VAEGEQDVAQRSPPTAVGAIDCLCNNCDDNDMAEDDASMKKTFQFDPTHTRIGFAARHMMVATVRGQFRSYSGTIEVEDDDPTTARADVTIDAASIDTGVADRDNHLRSADFLDVEHHPQLRFRSTRVEPLEEGRYRVQGELTIREVTRPVELTAEVEGPVTDPWGNERAGITLQGRISRSEFGLKWNALLEGGGAVVADQVRLEIDTEVVRAKEPATAG
jgi:polyisoprenoid-binding protein YceI